MTWLLADLALAGLFAAASVYMLRAREYAWAVCMGALAGTYVALSVMWGLM